MSAVEGHRARPGYLEVVRRLGSAQKAGRGPAYLRYVNRRLGRFVAAAAHVVGLTPNTVTAISAAFTFGAIAVLAVATPSWGVGVLVTVLLLVGFAFDSADGQLARLRGGGSMSGEWLDHVVDAVKVSTIHLAVLLSLHRSADLDDRWLLVPLGFSAVQAITFFSNQLHDQLVRSAPGAERRGDSSLTAALVLLPTDYGVLCLTFSLLGSPEAFMIAYGTLLALRSVHLALTLRQQFEGVRAIDRSRS